MRHLRTLVTVAAVVLAGSAALPARQAKTQIQFQIQDLMQDAVLSIDREIAALTDLLSSRTRSRDDARRRADVAGRLKGISRTLRRDAKQVDDLIAETKRSATARASIVNGYAAEFYGGRRLEFERAVNALSATPGPGDRDALERISAAAAALKRTADAMRRELEQASPPAQRETPGARPRTVKLQPMAQAAVAEAVNVVGLAPARKLELIKGLGMTAPPQGLQSEVVLSPRFPYKGQVAYLSFHNSYLDTGANTFDMRTGTCDLFLHITKKPATVLMVVTGAMTGSGKFGMADLGPGEMGQAPSWTDIGANGDEHVPLIVEASVAGWYRIAMSVQLNGNATFKLRQVDVSYLE